jgi:hypothetical protein
MKPRIAEIRRMVKLLDSEHDDVEDLARAVIGEAWSMFNEREWFCMVAHNPGVGWWVHGPYGSETEIKRAIKKEQIVSPGPGRSMGEIFRMVKGDGDV